MKLAPTQRAAIAYVEKYSKKRQGDALSIIQSVCRMSNISSEILTSAMDNIKKYARIALHFHPDRFTGENITVAESLLIDGIYKNQFQTQISNGHLEPVKGGFRHTWENNIFGSSFETADINLSERPKYGALDLMHWADGPSPRFGSCYFLLNPLCSRRSTFTYMDSHKNPRERGTLKHFDDIFAAMFAECFERNFALGRKDLTPSKLFNYLAYNFALPSDPPSLSAISHNLDFYIEAQLQGTVNLEKDADILVADSSFKMTQTGVVMNQLCKKYKIKMYWHPGFKLNITDIPSDFRGSSMPSLGSRISGSGQITAHRIGAAAADLKSHPQAWKDRGSYQECLQELKLLWHVLVKFGNSVSS
ncbi:DUF3626 domain-containing protein [Arachidicoccus soli]|uniref:DUF3626 domain-containing protein n=1 Tax=Arachidicoccus soli TaxID=2341117 RepID=A0A386HSS2_9BACT|nr:DUF3626 domain-containing protein [Arachidicoccus soli]AYD48334.1 DUF3626 domain-containing protein [Arachidicoccus soli]